MGSIGKKDSITVPKSNAPSHSQLGTPGKTLLEKYPTIEDALADKVVNPNYGKGDVYSRNCSLCTVAAALQMMGYDVEAMPRDKTWRGIVNVFDVDDSDPNSALVPPPSFNYAEHDYVKAYANPNKASGTTANAMAKKIEEFVSSWGPGAFGSISVSWKGSKTGHSMFVYQDGNTTKIADFQTGKIYSGHDAIKILMSGVKQKGYSVKRLDNAKIKDNIDNFDKMVKKKENGGK